MTKPKPVLIIGAIVGVLVVSAGIVLPWYFITYSNRPGEYPTWDLEFFGDTVDQSVNVTYEDIRKEFNATTYHFNQTKWWGEDGYESVISNFTGVALWDIIQYSGVDYGTANGLRFVANDGWESPILSLDDVENNKSLVIVYYIEEEKLLSGPEFGGDGYLMSAVNFSVNESKKSSHFNVKMLVGVEFVVDWDVALIGEYPLVEDNMTISYIDLLTHENLTRINTLINYTDIGVSSVLLNVTGVTLWSVIQYLDINYTTANGLRFISADESTTTDLDINDVENEEEKILIVYMEDGEFLNPSEDGYLKSLVDYTVNESQSSDAYEANFLSGLEFRNMD